MDPYKTLRVQPGASESDVRKAFRKLALQVWFYLMFLSSLDSYILICHLDFD
jgi:hypothetical protein